VACGTAALWDEREVWKIRGRRKPALRQERGEETIDTELVRGSGKWAQPGVPHKGWVCVGIEDLEEPSEICAMCEVREIRFVHYMQHTGYPEVLGCGCICAERMEEDYVAPREREKSLRAAASRKHRWLDRAWRTSSNGNPYINASGYNVVIFPLSGRAGAWGFRVTNRGTDDSIQSRKPYPSADAAKLTAFDAIVWMKQRGR
jgi:hypothetical protein